VISRFPDEQTKSVSMEIVQGIMKPAEGATEAGAQAILDYLKTLTKQMLAGRGRRRKTSSVESGHRLFGEVDQPDRGLVFH